MLDKLKGNAGSTGPSGPQGPGGFSAAKGDRGDRGEEGSPGPAGPFPGILPAGVTIRGAYAAAENVTSAGQIVRVGVPFGFTLLTEPTVHFLIEGETPPAQCPGSVGEPVAQSGNLCVFEHTRANAGRRGNL